VPHFVGMNVPSSIRFQVYEVAVLRHQLGYRSRALPLIKQLSTTLWCQPNNLVTFVELLMAGTEIIPPDITCLLLSGMIRGILGCYPKFISKVLEILFYRFAQACGQFPLSSPCFFGYGPLGIRPYTNIYGDTPVVALGTSRNAHTISGTYLCHWRWCSCTT